jgi:hypothetical protein
MGTMVDSVALVDEVVADELARITVRTENRNLPLVGKRCVQTPRNVLT